MDAIWVLLGVIAALIADYFVAREFYKAAVMKGWPQKKYFWFSFLLGLAGWLLVAALPDRGGPALTAFESDDLPSL
ncbi:MAG: hypothetical protein J5927_01275 [Oscillospiraceae bacterium]|nr:hypothetical protein [Oscillospiraceae bacterium]